MKVGILLLCVGTQVWFASAARVVHKHVTSRHHAQVGEDAEAEQYSKMCKAVLLKLLNIVDYDDKEGIVSSAEAQMKNELFEAISAAHYSSSTQNWMNLISRVSTLMYVNFNGAFDAGAIITTTDLNALISCSSHRTTMRNLEDITETEDGNRIVEGDIVVPPADSLLEQSQEPMNLSSSALETQPYYRRSASWAGEVWPNAEIPWCFHPNGVHDEVQRTWRKVLENIESRTCVRFKEVGVRRGYEECNVRPSVIVQSHEEGCWSYVGMLRFRSGSQQINLQHGSRGTCATPGIIAHEVGHSIGMSHEQSRADRDRHVTVNWHNIDEDKRNNFEIDKAYTGDEYDIFSLMHYGAYDFGKDRRVPTISPANPQHLNIMGQRVGFSSQDISQINKMYSCTAPGTSLQCGGKELNDDPSSRCHAKETCTQCRTPVSHTISRCSSLIARQTLGQNMLCRDSPTAECGCLFRLTRTEVKKRRRVLYNGRYYNVDDTSSGGEIQQTITCDKEEVVKLYNKDGSECQNYASRYTRRYRSA